jgi:hypothetical protein
MTFFSSESVRWELDVVVRRYSSMYTPPPPIRDALVFRSLVIYKRPQSRRRRSSHELWNRRLRASSRLLRCSTFFLIYGEREWGLSVPRCRDESGRLHAGTRDKQISFRIWEMTWRSSSCRKSVLRASKGSLCSCRVMRIASPACLLPCPVPLRHPFDLRPSSSGPFWSLANMATSIPVDGKPRTARTNVTSSYQMSLHRV